jgi:Ca-activated chloride channel family protein
MAALALRAQETARPTFPLDVDMVNVTVTVRDGKGKLVSDLSADDFVLMDEGRPRKVAVFGRAHDPGQDRVLSLDLGLLLDTSESMLPELKLAQEAASRFLESIPRARELYTVLFDEEIRISRYDSEHQQGLFERIHAAKGGGNTALYDALAAYLSRVEGVTGRKVVVLFSDGDDTRSSITAGDALAVIRSSAVSIYPVAFGVGFSARQVKARAFLQHIATISGGQVFSPTASKDLADVFRRILDELGAQYVLGFLPDPDAPAGSFRRLEVEVKRPGLKVRHRAGYTTPGLPSASN